MVLEPLWHQRTRYQFRVTISPLGVPRTLGGQCCHATNDRLHRDVRAVSKPPRRPMVTVWSPSATTPYVCGIEVIGSYSRKSPKRHPCGKSPSSIAGKLCLCRPSSGCACTVSRMVLSCWIFAEFTRSGPWRSALLAAALRPRSIMRSIFWMADELSKSRAGSRVGPAPGTLPQLAPAAVTGR